MAVSVPVVSSVAAVSSKSNLDMAFRRIMLTKLFSKSWGSPEIYKTLRHYQKEYAFKGAVMELIDSEPNMQLHDPIFKDDHVILEGSFTSPLYNVSASIFDSRLNVAKAHWRGYFPKPDKPRKALVIHLAPTGDQTYFLRKHYFVHHLLKKGVSSILLQNPFYGDRKPKDQWFSSLKNVSDLFVMGGSIICECCYILRWAQQQGYSPLGLSGISMGGYMASLAATNFRETPVALVPILSWTSAAPVFTKGAISQAIAWENLSKQLETDTGFQRFLEEYGWMDMMEDLEHPAYKLFPESVKDFRSQRLMWILMDEFTGLQNYPVPLDTNAIRFVVAGADGYIPRNEHIPHIETLWPGATIHTIPDAGHISAYLWHHDLFRENILDAFKLKPATLEAPTTTKVDRRDGEQLPSETKSLVVLKPIAKLPVEFIVWVFLRILGLWNRIDLKSIKTTAAVQKLNKTLTFNARPLIRKEQR